MQIELRKSLSNDRRVCIGTLTRQQAESAGIRSKGGDIGYFLYELPVDEGEDELIVLARFFSDEAAERMASIINRLEG
jgi:hypothetical protein